jgi:hypothetical protein
MEEIICLEWMEKVLQEWARRVVDNVAAATSQQKTVRINPKTQQLLPCRGKAGGWADARVEWAVAQEKVRVRARTGVATADHNLVRPMSITAQ